MQNLLWIGAEGFAPSLAECGWVTAILPDLASVPEKWTEVTGLCGFQPDVVVVAATDAPPMRGVERLPCLAVLYVPHTSAPTWEVSYAAGFDACIAGTSDFLANFQEYLPRERILWSPPHAGLPHEEPASSISRGASFLATAGETPENKKFFASLEKKLGNLKERATTLGQDARIAITANQPGDFSREFFDLVGNGWCVLSPRVGNGMERLFVDGEHFVGYAPDDAGDAAYRLEFLLGHPELIEHISKTGKTEIMSRHRPIQRAEAFTDFLCDLFLGDSAALVEARINNSADIGAFLNALYTEFKK